MARPASNVRSRILETVERQLRRPGPRRTTMDTVAGEAGCAKGLINYHFRTKSDLLASVAERMGQEREARWSAALSAASPEAVIGQSWHLITVEVSTGFLRAWLALTAAGDKVTVRTVNNSVESFCNTIALAVNKFLTQIGLAAAVSSDELGHLFAAALQGFEMQLSSGVPSSKVSSAHDALWVGILALTRPVA